MVLFIVDNLDVYNTKYIIVWSHTSKLLLTNCMGYKKMRYTA